MLALRDGAAAGRLTFDELAQRAELAHTALSSAELEQLVADLPAPPVQASPERLTRKRRRWDEDIVITAVAVTGGIEITVPEGIEVDVGGFAFMGGHEYRPGSEPIRPGTPAVRVRGYAWMGGLEVRVKRSHEHGRRAPHRRR